MQLSEHFSLEELTATQVRGEENTPTPQIVEVLKDTAARMETVRKLLGKPVRINSGYRSQRVNEIVGGAIHSAHLTGHAVDFICPQFGPPLEVCRAIVASAIDFDQVIEEGTWVHLSFATAMRKQILTKSSSGYVSGLPNQGEKK